jgi:glucokinase
MNNKVVAGIDIGGTKIAVALQDRKKVRTAFQRFPTQAELSPHLIIENIEKKLGEMLAASGATLAAIGIGCPGPIDIEKGLALSPTNLKKWKDFPVVEIFEKKFGVPVRFDNDANAAALGEFSDGAGRGFRDILYVTISTGIGGAVICGGKIHHGVRAGAGELGHAIVQPDGVLCRCGARGCLETIASGLSIARRAKEKLAETGSGFGGVGADEITARTVVEAVKSGDAAALSVWEETVRFLAIGIGNAITTLAPEAVIIGGGVSLAGDVLFEPLRSHLARNVKMLPIEQVKILPAALGDESGVYGALLLARQAVDDF